MSHFKREGQLPPGLVGWDRVNREVKKLGGTVEGGRVGKYSRYSLNAPDGHVWNATGDTATLVVEWRNDDPQDKPAAVTDALLRVRMGVSPA